MFARVELQLLLVHSLLQGMVSVNTLKTGSYLGRLLGNFGGILSRGGGDASVGSSGGGVGGGVAAEAVVSLAVHPIGNDTYVLGLCKDHKVDIDIDNSHGLMANFYHFRTGTHVERHDLRLRHGGGRAGLHGDRQERRRARHPPRPGSAVARHAQGSELYKITF